MIDKDLLDYLFERGMVTAYQSGDCIDTDNDILIRYQPKRILTPRMRYGQADLVAEYLILAESLDLKEEFLSRINEGINITYGELSTLGNADINNSSFDLQCMLSIILYHIIKDTPGAIDKIQEDFKSLLKNTAYHIELYTANDYTHDWYKLTSLFPLKIAFNKEEIADKNDVKLLNSEVFYSTLAKDNDQEDRYLPIKFIEDRSIRLRICVEAPEL